MPLYKFNVDCGRMGELEGAFEADESQIENLIGQDVYFGEVLGKHSEIRCEIKPEYITLIDADQVL